MRRGLSPWNDERDAKLRQLWSESFSASEIAQQIGFAATRNSIIGRAHRLKLPARGTRKNIGTDHEYQERKFERFKRERRCRVVIPESAPLPEMRITPSDDAVSMRDAAPQQCRWPVGDPRDTNFHFCGAAITPGTPYCLAHARRAFM